ncbi:MAG: DUF3883 domain-containing protein [Bacteroidetes bacterium]|nr:DUF3883 domain-containing protein [Bacteroidota bacterium]
MCVFTRNSEAIYYIEVKGHSGSDCSVMLSENEMDRLTQLVSTAWLYIVAYCKSTYKIFEYQITLKF